MSWHVLGRTIEKVGVIGSGQIGPDIALHFSKVLEPHGVAVVVVDISPKALEGGAQKTAQKLEKGVATGAFKPDQAQKIRENIQWSSDYASLKGASLVVEAATEDLPIKKKIFQTLEGMVADTTILTSNSSHLEPERIFSDAKHPARCLVTHYFFPAERNPALEVVPHAGTDASVTAFLLGFYELIGKAPIRVGSRYGYALDPIFEGLFLAALLARDAGLGTVPQIDQVAVETLGLGVGPFTAMNLAGGNPLTLKGLPEYAERVNRWFHAPESFHKQVADNQPWPTAKRGEAVTVSPEKKAQLADYMLGAYLGLAGEVLDSGITNIADLELGLELGLVITPAFTLANRIGVQKALDLVKTYNARFPAFPIPRCLVEQARKGQPFKVAVVLRQDHGDVAVLTLRRPRVLNALSHTVFEQIGEHLRNIKTDNAIRAVVVKGHGPKAFAAGADVTELAKLQSAADATRVCLRDQAVVNEMENLGKPVVAALNGLALGGGSELAQAATVRIAVRGLPVCFGQPEVNLGIIPGCGGTQRLPRLIGVEAAWPLLRTGKPVPAETAKQLGFVHELVENDLEGAAVELARALADGKVQPKPMPKGPIPVPPALPDVSIGDLSQAVDRILIRAIREGAALPLSEGLQLEARLFGECFSTEDARIGLDNFVKNGPKKRAAFVHR
jgi:enoyl-CoA hydratase/3-hydroxyacyl-CoA dehydrogenase